MDLAAQIDNDYQTALRSRDEDHVGLLRLLRSALKNEAINSLKKQLTEEEILSVISREVKKRKEAIALYEQAGRSELAKKENLELSYLSAYLPRQLSAEEIKKIIDDILNSGEKAGPADFGRIMSLVMAQLKNKADGETVSQLVRVALAHS